MTNHSIHIKTELVNGKCPNCNEESILISLASQYYKCTICNHTLEQKVNGKISYIPITTKTNQALPRLNVFSDG